MKFHEAIDKYINYIKNTKGYSDRTIESYRRDIEQAVAFVDAINIESNIAFLKFNDINKFLDSVAIKFSNKTRNRKMYSLKSFYIYLKKYGIVNNNPCDVLESAKMKKKNPVYLTKKEAKRFLESVNEATYRAGILLERRDKLIFNILIFTGARVSELINLNVGDVYNKDTINIIGKGKKEREIPIHKNVKEALNLYLNEYKDYNSTSPLLVSKSYNRIGARTVQRLTKKYCNYAGINKEVTPHKLRHTFATMFFSKTKDLRTLQELLGHESLATTEIYTHINNKDKAKKVNSLDFME